MLGDTWADHPARACGGPDSGLPTNALQGAHWPHLQMRRLRPSVTRGLDYKTHWLFRVESGKREESNPSQDTDSEFCQKATCFLGLSILTCKMGLRTSPWHKAAARMKGRWSAGPAPGKPRGELAGRFSQAPCPAFDPFYFTSSPPRTCL